MQQQHETDRALGNEKRDQLVRIYRSDSIDAPIASAVLAGAVKPRGIGPD
jgi:hypothetical protein